MAVGLRERGGEREERERKGEDDVVKREERERERVRKREEDVVERERGRCGREEERRR